MKSFTTYLHLKELDNILRRKTLFNQIKVGNKQFHDLSPLKSTGMYTPYLTKGITLPVTWHFYGTQL